MALATTVANAQLRWGAKGGVNFSRVAVEEKKLDTDGITGYHIGPVVEVMSKGLLSNIGLEAALLYTRKGFEYSGKDFRNDYLEVPVNFKWRLNFPLVKPFVAIGPYAGVRIGGKEQWDVIIAQIESKSFIAGMNLGLGLDIVKKLQLGMNFNWAITDNYKTLSVLQAADAITAKNRTFALTAAVFF
jgi:hypothetical protein